MFALKGTYGLMEVLSLSDPAEVYLSGRVAQLALGRHKHRPLLVQSVVQRSSMRRQRF